MAAIKRAYHLVALLALLHVLAAGGVTGYLAATGRLTSERVEQVAAALRGELSQPATAQADEPEAVVPPSKSAESLEQDQLTEEIAHFQIARRRAELAQQAATIRAARLEVIRQREALQREAEELDVRYKNRAKREESASFKKELELFSGMKPKVALSYLLDKAPEDAARLMLLMDTRKSKKILESAKTAADKEQLGEIMQLMGDINPGGDGSPSGPTGGN